MNADALRKGFIALTDPDWYSFLESQPRLDEVNFWQPRPGGFKALASGDPFLFKLRAPFKAICGFGFFQRYEVLPAWLAWDCFQRGNGAADMQSMVGQILSIRGEDSPSARLGNFPIGCIMISAPVFFPEDQWVDPPADWAPTGIQRGKGYSLERGEGKRIFAECLARANAGGRYWNVEREPALVSADAPRYGAPVTVRPRLGQGTFTFAVRDAYGGACAVTHEHSTPVLEAAHIKPYAEGGQHRVDNGLLLRRDLHVLFDRGYVTVTPDHRFRVGRRLKEEYKNGRTYYVLDGERITLPDDARQQPSRELLDWHGQTIFRG